MDLSGSARTPKFPFASAIFGCYSIARVYKSETVSSLCANISLGAGESLTIEHHMRLTHTSRIMRTYHTHFGVPLGIAPGWWDDRKRNHQQPVLPITFAWIFPTISAVHFLAFAFLAITFWSIECVITGIEGLVGSGSVTNVTGILFRMRNTFCWTVRMYILLASTHSTASWSSHLNMKIAQLV